MYPEWTSLGADAVLAHSGLDADGPDVTRIRTRRPGLPSLRCRLRLIAVLKASDAHRPHPSPSHLPTQSLRLRRPVRLRADDWVA